VFHRKQGMNFIGSPSGNVGCGETCVEMQNARRRMLVSLMQLLIEHRQKSKNNERRKNKRNKNGGEENVEN